MTWFDILKQPKLSLSPKTLTAYKIPPKEEEGGPCNRRLKEYSEKLKNMDWDLYAPRLPKELKMFYRIHTKESVKKRNDLWLYDPKKETKQFDEFKREIDSQYPETYHANGSDLIFHKYEPIPENVACKALEILDEPDSWWVSEKVDDYSIYLEERNDMPNYWGKGLSLVISKTSFLHSQPNILHPLHMEFSETSEVNLGHIIMFGVRPIEKEWTNFDSIDVSWR